RDWLRNQGIAKEEIVYINFESLSNEEWTDYKKLYEAITAISKERKRKIFLLLDEIQNVHSWEKVINSLRIDIDCDITITGSNAKLLSGELATHLAGRYIEIQVYPLSFEEYLNFRNARSEQGKVPEYFEEFLKLGGMPGLHEIHGSSTAKYQYLSDIFDSVLLKDVITRNKIRDTELLRRIIIFLMDNIGSSFSAQTVSNFLKNLI
ncbi:ATP-binding protein, partial [Turicimonas muris]|uniref:ATP-binding protein n=1 Tax=Turicimonas muris TaxID=1796652 RepID=UPI003F67BF9B